MVQHKPFEYDRRSGGELPLSEYFRGTRRFYNAKYAMHVVKVFAGDWYISGRDDEMLTTILGSCVAACIRDPVLRVGGMNHFLLPGDDASGFAPGAARYGAFAMESLIKAIVEAGGDASRLEIKVFGGANIVQDADPVGSRNAQFVREFLRNGGFKIAAEDLEGALPRSICYYPASGETRVRPLRRKDDLKVAEEEARYARDVAAAATKNHPAPF